MYEAVEFQMLFFLVPSNILFAIFGTFKTEQAEEVCDQMLHHFSVPRHLVLSPSEKPIDAWS